MILRFTDYAYDTYNRSETAWRLTEEFDWDEEIAEEFSRFHKPMYEVEGVFNYDTETKEVTVIEAIVNGVRMVPAV